MDNPTAESSGAIDTNQAASLFSSALGGEPIQKDATESPEAAAERLAAEDLAGEGSEVPSGENDGAAPAGDKVTIEVDGKAVELTRTELAEHYKNGLRQADYTRKTMEVADARKTAEAETNKVRQERQELAQKLQTYAIRLEGDLQDQSKIDWKQLLATDPVAYLEQKSIFEERQANLGAAQQELHRLNVQHQAEHTESVKAFIAAQQQELLAKLPEWKDPEKAKVGREAIASYLASQGFTKEEIGNTVDHRNVIAYDKAMKYDALIARAAAATKKVAALPTKVERPGNGEMRPDGRTEAMKRLTRSGSVQDAAAVFAGLL